MTTNKIKLIGNGFVYLISTVLIKGIVFFTMPLFTKILTVEDFGIYNTYMSYEAILSIIITLGAPVIVRNAWIDYKENYDIFKKSLYSIIFKVFTIVFLTVVMLEYLFDNRLSYALGLSSLLLICLIFHSSGYGLVLIVNEDSRMEYKAKRVLFLSLLITVSSIICSLFIILRQENSRYLGRIIGAASPYIIFWCICCLRFHANKTKIEKNMYRYILSIGIPAVPFILSENIMMQSDRIMIERLRGAFDAGIYSAISTVATIFLIVCTSFESVWAPWSYSAMAEGKTEKLSRIFNYLTVLIGAMAIGFGMIAPELLKLSTSKQEYWNNTALIYPLIMMEYIYLINKIPTTILFYKKKSAVCSFSIGIAAIINMFLNYFGIRFFGFGAAAITSLVSTVLLFFMMCIVCKKNKCCYYSIFNVFIMTIITAIIVLIEYSFYENLSIRYFVGIGALVTFMITALIDSGKKKWRVV